MSVDKVKQYFSKYGMESKVPEFEVSSVAAATAPSSLPFRSWRNIPGTKSGWMCANLCKSRMLFIEVWKDILK